MDYGFNEKDFTRVVTQFGSNILQNFLIPETTTPTTTQSKNDDSLNKRIEKLTRLCEKLNKAATEKEELPETEAIKQRNYLIKKFIYKNIERGYGYVELKKLFKMYNGKRMTQRDFVAVGKRYLQGLGGYFENVYSGATYGKKVKVYKVVHGFIMKKERL